MALIYISITSHSYIFCIIYHAPKSMLIRQESRQYSRVHIYELHRTIYSLLWRHNERYSVSNHQPHDCLLNRLFRRRSKKASTRRVTGLCARNSSGTGKFSAQMASDVENVSIWWRHHVTVKLHVPGYVAIQKTTILHVLILSVFIF